QVRHGSLRLGRHRELVRGNVVAVGASYGAPDPLLVADTHFAILHISRLLALLTSGGAEVARANARVAERWDAARDLAALHYGLNRRATTPFWKKCEELGSDPKISHFPPAVELRERGLRSLRSDAEDDGLYGAHGLDVLLTGLGLRPARLTSTVSAGEWSSLAEMRARVVEAALTSAEAHAVTEERRTLLDELVHADDGWCGPLAERMAHAAPTRGRSHAALAAWTGERGIDALFPSDYARGEPKYPESPVIDFGKFLRRVPAVVLRPRDQDQLAECMTTLYRRGIPFKVRGTGHSNGGQTLIDDGAVIDTRWLRRIVADDPVGQTLTIEGGCWMEAAQTWLHQQGKGRWLTNLLMHWRVTMAGSLAVGGFGDTSHYRGTQLEMVERMVVMTPDGVRHAVRRGDPLFDYSLGGRGQLGVMTEVTLKTEVRPGHVVARVVRWPSMAAFLEDAVTIIRERRFDILRGRIKWEAATVDGAVGAFRERERGDERGWMSDLHGTPTPRIETIDYYTENMKPPSAHWLPATPAVEFALPFDPNDIPAALALLAELRDKIIGGGLAPYTPLGTSFMVLPTVDTLPLAPVPKTTPLAIMIALRPEMPADKVPAALPVVQDIGHWALSRGGKLYLMCVEPDTPDFLARQFGDHLDTLRALKREHDPLGLLNPGLLV
ncbi:MAG: FAD-binding protein, partial [Deltaproteobacteria bacterium]